MNIVKKTKENHPATNSYAQINVNSELLDQIRSLSQQVKGLDQYKQLCEQRIQELFPNHPVPIKPEHLGASVPDSVLGPLKKRRVQKSQQIINKSINDTQNLSDEYLQTKLDETVKDKLYLEESLRSEILTNEEQRAYIEILKQFIEQNFEGLENIKLDPKELKEIIGSKSSSLRNKYTSLKNTAQDQQSRIQKLESELISKDQNYEEAKLESQELENHLKKAAKALQSAEDDIEKLEEEKSSLIEYIENHSQKEQEMETQMNDLAKLFENMKNNYENNVKILQQEKNIQLTLIQEKENLNKEINKLKTEIKELNQTLTTKKNKIQENQKALKKLKEDYINLEYKNQSLMANISTLSQTLKENELENENFQKEIQIHKIKNNEKDEQIKNMRIENSLMAQENKKNTELVSDFKSKIEFEIKRYYQLQNEYQEQKINLQDLESKVARLESKYEIIEKENKIKDTQEKSQNLAFSKIKHELNTLKADYEDANAKQIAQSTTIEDLTNKNISLSTHINQISIEMQGLQSDNQKILKELQNSNTKIHELNSICDSLQDLNKTLEKSLKEEKALSKQFEDQILNQNHSINLLNTQVKQTIIDINQVQSEFQTLSIETQDLKTKNSTLASDIYKEKTASHRLKEDLKQLNHKIESKEIEILNLNRYTIESWNILSNFSIFCDSKFEEYFSLLSSNFRSFIKYVKEKSDFDVKDQVSYAECSVDEIKFLLEVIYQLREDANQKNCEINMLLSRLEGLNSETDSYKIQLAELQKEIYENNQETIHTQTYADNQISNLKKELNSLKSEKEGLIQENYHFKTCLQDLIQDKNKMQASNEYIIKTLKAQEYENTKLRTEITGFDYKKTQQADHDRPSQHLAKIQNELEILERERLDIQCQLLGFESETRSKQSSLYQKLQKNLIYCEKQIQNYKRFITTVQTDRLSPDNIRKSYL